MESWRKKNLLAMPFDYISAIHIGKKIPLAKN